MKRLFMIFFFIILNRFELKMTIIEEINNFKTKKGDLRWILWFFKKFEHGILFEKWDYIIKSNNIFKKMNTVFHRICLGTVPVLNNITLDSTLPRPWYGQVRFGYGIGTIHLGSRQVRRNRCMLKFGAKFFHAIPISDSDASST